MMVLEGLPPGGYGSARRREREGWLGEHVRGGGMAMHILNPKPKP